jgi:threonine dehydrogenase-like Zn-dependent dehydrogenase
MGLLSLQGAAAHGAAAVLTTARRPAVRSLSESLGAEASLDPDDPSTPDRIARFRPDFVVDAAGGPPAAGLAGNSLLEMALDVVAAYGTVLELSDLTEPIRLSPRIREKSLRLVFGQWSYYYNVYPYTLAMLGDGRMRCAPLVTHEVRGLENLPEALELKVDRSSSGAIQVQLILDAGPFDAPDPRA